MAEGTIAAPRFVDRLTRALRETVHDAEVAYERVRGDRFRFSVVSDHFAEMGHPERQRIVWDVAERVLNKAELVNVAMIITMSAAEV